MEECRGKWGVEKRGLMGGEGEDREREGKKGMKILHIAVHRVYQFVLAIAENTLAKYTAL